MPKVKIDGKVRHFPYTKAGKAAAKAMENRKKMKKGMHKMPDGHMMSDAKMSKMMK